MRFSATNFTHIRNFFDSYYGIKLNSDDNTLQIGSQKESMSFLSDLIGQSFGRESLEVFEDYLKVKQQYELSPTDSALKSAYENSLRKLTVDAEDRMSSLRTELSPYLKINQTGEKLEDKFIYGYLSASKTKNGFENLELHFLDTKKVLLEADSNFKLRQKTEGGSFTLHQNRGFKGEDWINLAADFQTLGFSDSEIATLIQIQNSVSQENIMTMINGIATMPRSETDSRKIGIGRSFDFTYRDQNMDVIDSLMLGTFQKNYTPSMLSENMPGVLAGDSMVIIGDKVVNFSLKSQVSGSATLDHSKSAMLESLYLAFSRSDLLSEILTPGQSMHNIDMDTATLLNAVQTTLRSDPEAQQQFMELMFEGEDPQEMLDEGEEEI